MTTYVPPSTADLVSMKAANHISQSAFNTHSLTFSSNDTAHSLTGYLYIQTSQRAANRKTDPSTWQEMYVILDPYTKIISLLQTPTSAKAYGAISLTDGRVIYGGEVGRTSTSVNGGKQKTVKMHAIELTVPPRNTKHFLASSDKELSMGWIRDFAKVMHLGANKQHQKENKLRRVEEQRKQKMAKSLIKQVRRASA